ncbi:MAG: hypothetical protein KF824_09790 [Fimbriimonadaceae bacterium]|nr:MAG: hypothetical protein KF824_09790 [Fimbriimonadaceae bacterium]
MMMSNYKPFKGVSRLILALLAVSAVGLAFGQKRPVVQSDTPINQEGIKSGETKTMLPWDKKIKISTINPRNFFPKITNAAQARGIRPSNPDIKLTKSGYQLDRSQDGLGLPTVGGNTGNSTAVLGARFPGVSFTGWFPPDVSMAVGSTHVVQVTNTTVGFFNKSTGTLEFSQVLDGTGFFSGQNVGSFTFDPRVIYDPDTNRFIMVVLDVDFDAAVSRVQIAISTDADPFNPWTLVTLDNTITIGGAPLWGDYPTVSTNEDYIVMTFNHFGFFTNNVLGTMFALSKDLSRVQFFNTGQFSTSMAKRSVPGTTGPAYGVGIVHPFLGAPPAANVFAVKKSGVNATISNMQVQLPIYMPQDGGASMRGIFIDTLGGRMMDASVNQNSLVFALTVNAGPDNLGFQYPFAAAPNPGRSKVRWGEISLNTFPNGRPALFQSGDMGYANTFATCLPAIIKNNAGEIAVVATRSSAGETPKVIAATRRSIDVKGTLGPIAIFGSSANFNITGGGTSRWGDYAGIAIDPLDPTRFWGSHEIFSNSSLEWGTEIFSFVIGSPTAVTTEPTGVTPVFGSVAGGNVDSFDTLGDSDVYSLNTEYISGRGNYAGYDLTFNPGGTVNNVDITLNMVSTVDGVTGFIYMFNVTTNDWDLVWNTRLKATPQEIVIVIDSARMSKYINGSGNIVTRVVALNAERRRGVAPASFALNSDFGAIMKNRN